MTIPTTLEPGALVTTFQYGNFGKFEQVPALFLGLDSDGDPVVVVIDQTDPIHSYVCGVEEDELELGWETD